MRAPTALLTGLVLSLSIAWADGPADNIPAKVRPVPPPGVEIPAADKAELEAGLKTLDESIEALKSKSVKDATVAELLPDVIIYSKAVHDALTYREFFNVKEVAKARSLLKEGQGRAEGLQGGKSPWTTQRGLVVRGYRSKIDGSVQPYGLVIPASYTDQTAGRYRLDLWFHGRGETLSEVNFLDEHRTQAGQFTPADTIVLHPYGRYCNANKFAGEVDSLEAIESVSRRYRIDEDRISVRGFSMGGAAVWQFAVHYTDRWFAANPGAGFAETPDFLKVFQRETLTPTWYEQKLWGLYDCDKIAVNLRQLPTVAYSGELDNQKQAADIMATALRREGIELTHIIGPKTKHAYHPDSRREVERRMAALAVKGRDRTPREIHFASPTLRYNRMFWLTIDGLQEHWGETRVDASIQPNATTTGPGVVPAIQINTRNVSALSLDFLPGTASFLRAYEDAKGGVVIGINNGFVNAPGATSDGSYRVHLAERNGVWSVVAAPPSGLVKRHGLQGPIDDAFYDSFVMVRPTGKPLSERAGAWVKGEMEHAVGQWRQQFRGEARVKDDTLIDDADIASSNLVLWGDPQSNAVWKRIADRLPIRWLADKIVVGDQSFPADDHAPIAIYPNPLNPERYVVLNSGFTFREYDYLNNARQVPKLPDWAIVDLKTPPNSRYPGKIVAADFFGERWEVRPSRSH